MEDLKETRTIEYFDFDLQGDRYECRGELTYDDEHDEIPQPELWNAAHILALELQKEGYDCIISHSEKGWVEVYFTLKN